MHRRGFLGASAGLAVPLVAGCTGDGGSGGGGGGGDSGGGSGSGGGEMYGGGGDGGGTTQHRTTTAGDGGAMAAYPDYNWEQLTRADAAETSSVTARGSSFQPLIAKVSAGADVAFTNEDSSPHTVTIPALSVDEQLSGGSSTSVTFEEAGTFDYVCTLHPPDMLGRVVVE